MLTRHSLGRQAWAAFTDRYGGVSAPPYDELNLGHASGEERHAVAENRRRAARRLGLDPARVFWMRQHHGDTVAFVRRPFAGDPPDADALLTTMPGAAVAVLVADCVPVLVADPVIGVVGAAHAGRSGLARKVVPALVSRATELGADPRRMSAITGPAICGGCYEVPAAMQEEVASVAPEAWCRTRSGAPGLDLRAGVADQLRRAGIGDVRNDARCTRESPGLYSYRRDGRSGRLAGYAWLEAA